MTGYQWKENQRRGFTDASGMEGPHKTIMSSERVFVIWVKRLSTCIEFRFCSELPSFICNYFTHVKEFL